MARHAEHGGGKPSLRARLGRHVLLPLAVTWGLGSVVVLTVGGHFAAQAFDRSLLDDAYAVAAHVRKEVQGLALDLTPQQVSTLLFNQNETVYFAVLGPGGQLIAGDPRLLPARIPPGASYEFAEFSLEDTPVRSVSLRRDEPAQFTVVMAQTTAIRAHLLQRLLAYSGLAQLWLLMVLAWWLRRIIERDLRPLTDLQHALDGRDAGDLTPLPVVLTRDATTRDVQRLGDAVNSLLERLQQSLVAQREFAGNVAHELRTPLAGIRAQASLALAQEDPVVWRAELHGIVRAQERASRLVDQLLALARAGEASAGLKLEPLALNEVARDLVLRFLPKADALGVDLGAEGLDEPVQVRGDIALVEGILTNLLDNALRYGAGAVPRVTVSLHREADAITLSVSDNGPGLDDADAGRLTQRWTQGVPGHRLGQGAGLGLAIVRRYAALLKAQFSLEPGAGGQGLSARLRFPL